jgi:hypothetical protein
MQSDNEKYSGYEHIEGILRYSMALNQSRVEENPWMAGRYEPIAIKLPRMSGHTTVLARLAKEMGDHAFVVTDTLDQARFLRKNHGIEAFTITQTPPRGLQMPKVVFVDNAYYCSKRNLDEWMQAFPVQFILLG